METIDLRHKTQLRFQHMMSGGLPVQSVNLQHREVYRKSISHSYVGWTLWKNETSDNNINLKDPLKKKTMAVGSTSLFVLDFPRISVYIKIQTDVQEFPYVSVRVSNISPGASLHVSKISTWVSNRV